VYSFPARTDWGKDMTRLTDNSETMNTFTHLVELLADWTNQSYCGAHTVHHNTEKRE